jgi:hypothetical protein
LDAAFLSATLEASSLLIAAHRESGSKWCDRAAALVRFLGRLQASLPSVETAQPMDEGVTGLDDETGLDGLEDKYSEDN